MGARPSSALDEQQQRQVRGEGGAKLQSAPGWKGPHLDASAPGFQRGPGASVPSPPGPLLRAALEVCAGSCGQGRWPLSSSGRTNAAGWRGMGQVAVPRGWWPCRTTGGCVVEVTGDVGRTFWIGKSNVERPVTCPQNQALLWLAACPCVGGFPSGPHLSSEEQASVPKSSPTTEWLLDASH